MPTLEGTFFLVYMSVRSPKFCMSAGFSLPFSGKFSICCEAELGCCCCWGGEGTTLGLGLHGRGREHRRVPPPRLSRRLFRVCVCQSPAPPGAGPACEGKEEEDEEEDEEGRSLPRAAAWGADPQGAAYQLRLALHRLADQLLDLFALAAPRLGVAAVALPALRHGSKLCIAHPPAPAGGTRGAAGGGGRGLGGARRPRGPTWGVLGCSGTSPEGVSARTWK